MDRKDLKRLRRDLSDELENDLYVSDVNIVDKLIEEGHLSTDDWESINALNRHKKKVKQLIKCLGRTENPLETYMKLCELLDKGHKHLVPRVKSVLDRYRDLVIYRRETCKEMRLVNVRVPGEHDEKGEYLDDDIMHSNIRFDIDLNKELDSPQKVSNDTAIVLPTEINDLNRNYFVIPKQKYCRNRPYLRFQANIDPSQVRLSIPSLHSTTLKTHPIGEEFLKIRPISCENTESSDENDSDSQINNISVCELSWEKNNFSHSALDKYTHKKRGQTSSKIVPPQCERLKNNPLSSCASISIKQKNEFRTNSNENMFNGKCGTCISNNFPIKLSRSRMLPIADGLMSDIECNIHQETSVATCSECKGRKSCYFSDENINDVYRSSTTDIRKYDNCFLSNTRTDCISDTECNMHLYDDIHLSCSECFWRQHNPSKIENNKANLKARKQCKLIDCSAGERLLNEIVLGDGCYNNTSELADQQNSFSCESNSFKEQLSSESSSDISLNSTSDSEINTDVNLTDLGVLETKIYNRIQSLEGSLSDFMDNMIEKGKLNEDDVLSINAQGNENKKMALLVKLICKPSGLREHDEVSCDSPAVSKKSHSSESHRVVSKSHEMIIYRYPMTVIKNFDKTFDILIDKVNNGHLDVCMIPQGPTEQCITYYLQACDKLYHNSLDTVEILIDKAAEAATRSKHQVQLQGEVFTAKTWLYLVTGRVGKMFRCLQEHEQLLAFMPGMWSANAYGWFYHDYARCFLQLQSYSNNKHINAKEYYKRQALECARKSIEYFKTSDNSDGPIGIGFASSLLVDALLEVGGLDYGRYIDIRKADIDKAEEVLRYVEQQFSDKIPPVLKTSYLLNKCDICYRKHEYLAALEYADECFRLCATMEIHRNLNVALKRIKTIGSVIQTNQFP